MIAVPEMIGSVVGILKREKVSFGQVEIEVDTEGICAGNSPLAATTNRSINHHKQHMVQTQHS